MSDKRIFITSVASGMPTSSIVTELREGLENSISRRSGSESPQTMSSQPDSTSGTPEAKLPGTDTSSYLEWDSTGDGAEDGDWPTGSRDATGTSTTPESGPSGYSITDSGGKSEITMIYAQSIACLGDVASSSVRASQALQAMARSIAGLAEAYRPVRSTFLYQRLFGVRSDILTRMLHLMPQPSNSPMVLTVSLSSCRSASSDERKSIDRSMLYLGSSTSTRLRESRHMWTTLAVGRGIGRTDLVSALLSQVAEDGSSMPRMLSLRGSSKNVPGRTFAEQTRLRKLYESRLQPSKRQVAYLPVPEYHEPRKSSDGLFAIRKPSGGQQGRPTRGKQPFRHLGRHAR